MRITKIGIDEYIVDEKFLTTAMILFSRAGESSDFDLAKRKRATAIADQLCDEMCKKVTVDARVPLLLKELLRGSQSNDC